MKDFDLLIVGLGPAAYTASVYSSRYQVKHALVGELPGGLMGEAHKICNWPGEIEISGFDLYQKMEKQVKEYGVEMIFSRVEKIRKEKDIFYLTLTNGQELRARSVLLATGTKHRHLGLPEEKRFVGHGLSYCATCDAGFYKDKITAVVGSGNSAMTAALYLGELAEKVYMIVRGTELKGEISWIKAIQNNPKIEILFGTQIREIKGQQKVEILSLDKGKDLEVSGLFVEVGSDPDNVLGAQLDLETDQYGYLVVGKDQATNVSGLYAAGDLTSNSNNFRQIVTAVAEGAIATESIFKFLKK